MNRSMPYRPFSRRRQTWQEIPTKPASRGLFITAMTLGAVLIAVVMWCVLNPIPGAF